MNSFTPEILNSNIGREEYKRLMEILEHYNITSDKIMKEKNSYKIKTNDNIYCLKKIKDSKRNILKSFQLANYLNRNGFNNIPDYIKTKSEKDLLKYNGHYYYLMHWIEGRKCSYSNFTDISNIASLLANFHLKSQGFFSRYTEIDFKSYNWYSRLSKYNKTFNIINDIIINKKIKTMFDIQYLKSIDFFKEQLELAVKLLNGSSYNRILQNSKLKYTLCINNFSFKNILLDNDGNYYFTCLEDTSYNINLFDISKFIRKILSREEYAWEFKYAAEIIDCYCNVNPLSKNELTILLSLIIFPKSFYKLGKKRYIKRKNSGEDKYLTDLYKIIQYTDKQGKFVDEYIQYYSIM